MKLAKGKTIHAPVLASGVLSQTLYQVTVKDLVHSGDHFYLYLGEDFRGAHVCLKVIRYCGEEVSLSAKDYIERRRSMLMSEQRLLGISHPCLPAPIVMFSLENDSGDDQKTFRGVPEWESLRLSEPVLVLEYLTGFTLPQLTDKLRMFSLQRRIQIAVKTAKLCQFVEQQGYLLHDLHPSNIILKPSHDDNIYLTGLHNARTTQNGSERPPVPPSEFSGTVRGYEPLELQENGHPYDERVDVFQLGILLYYLLTLSDPAREGHTGKKNDDHFLGKKEKSKLEKAIRSLDSSGLWLMDLLQQALDPRPEFRIPDMATLLHYLEFPPQDRVSFKIQKSSRDQTEIRIVKTPSWSTHIKVRLENIGNPKIITHNLPLKKVLRLPGVGSGRVVCAVAATDEKQTSWWEYQTETISPEIRFTPLSDLPPDKFGFEWEVPPEFHHVSIQVTDDRGNTISLGDFRENRVDLPPDASNLPYYEPLQVTCTSYFQFSGDVVRGNTFSRTVTRYPPIPAPIFREAPEGIYLEMVAPKKQAEIYVELELLHNGWPRAADEKKNQTLAPNQQKIAYFLSRDQFDIFEQQQFSFRALIDDLGWRTGPAVEVSITPPPVLNLRACETQPGCFQLSWDAVAHLQLKEYQIECAGDSKRSRTATYTLSVPFQVLQENRQKIAVAVYGVYCHEGREILSIPATAQLEAGEWMDWFRCRVDPQVTPFYVAFQVSFENPAALESLKSALSFQRQGSGEEAKKELGRPRLAAVMELRDEAVRERESYCYSLILEERGICLFEQRVEVPCVSISGTRQEIGYENCLWEIRVDMATAALVEGEVEIRRKGDIEKSHSFKWPRGEEFYYWNDTGLSPGQTYEYTASVPLSGHSPHVLDLGKVTTREFKLKETIQTAYNYAVITWEPSPVGQIDCIEIYDAGKRLIGITQANSITLENLEPERTYVFPLKYRYSSGKSIDGLVLSFTTLSYTIPVEVADTDSVSFRLRWNIPDKAVKSKIQELRLEVSENLGTHKLAANARTVQLRNLYPATTYQWKLCAVFKSESTATLAVGEATTLVPEFQVEVEVGLVHHLSWNAPVAGIEKVEVHRDDTLLLETTENEMYDSDFKGGKEVVYKFYYLMKNGRRILAGQKTVKPLSMADLYGMLKIDPGIGIIRWDFNDLKNFKYLKYVELFRDESSIYKQGSHAKLVFEDVGEGGKIRGLSTEPMNFQLAIVGVAPIARKCKKKWVLNIKGIQCSYPKFPTDFRISREYSCIYFEWDYTPTALLKEITLWRAADGFIVYQGPNEPCLVYDDNAEKGLSPTASYIYYLKMDYESCDMAPESCNDYYEDLEKPFDIAALKNRLEIAAKIADDVLEIRWNKEIATSISHIRATVSHGTLGRLSLWSKLLGQSKWTEFFEGQLQIPIPSHKFQYQLHFQDYCGKRFSALPESSEDLATVAKYAL